MSGFVFLFKFLDFFRLRPFSDLIFLSPIAWMAVIQCSIKVLRCVKSAKKPGCPVSYFSGRVSWVVVDASVFLEIDSLRDYRLECGRCSFQSLYCVEYMEMLGYQTFPLPRRISGLAICILELF